MAHALGELFGDADDEAGAAGAAWLSVADAVGDALLLLPSSPAAWEPVPLPDAGAAWRCLDARHAADCAR
jgi:hypothetical protein